MIIDISSRFKRSYKKLPEHIQDDFDIKIRLFANSPRDAKLSVHKLHGKLQSCLSFYLKDGYRVLFEFSEKNNVKLLDVGSHDKYKQWGN